MATPYGDMGMDEMTATPDVAPTAPPVAIPAINPEHRAVASEYDSALSKRGGKGEKIMPVEELDKWATKIGLQTYDVWIEANPRLSDYGSTPRLHYAAYVDAAMHDIEMGKMGDGGYGDIGMDEAEDESVVEPTITMGVI